MTGAQTSPVALPRSTSRVLCMPGRSHASIMPIASGVPDTPLSSKLFKVKPAGRPSTPRVCRATTTGRMGPTLEFKAVELGLVCVERTTVNKSLTETEGHRERRRVPRPINKKHRVRERQKVSGHDHHPRPESDCVRLLHHLHTFGRDPSHQDEPLTDRKHEHRSVCEACLPHGQLGGHRQAKRYSVAQVLGVQKK